MVSFDCVNGSTFAARRRPHPAEIETSCSAACLALPAVPETTDEVIVDHAGRLQQRIADGGADEAEAALLQRLAHAVGQFGAGRHVGLAAPAVAQRLAVDEGP